MKFRALFTLLIFIAGFILLWWINGYAATATEVQVCTRCQPGDPYGVSGQNVLWTATVTDTTLVRTQVGTAQRWEPWSTIGAAVLVYASVNGAGQWISKAATGISVPVPPPVPPPVTPPPPPVQTFMTLTVCRSDEPTSACAQFPHVPTGVTLTYTSVPESP